MKGAIAAAGEAALLEQQLPEQPLEIGTRVAARGVGGADVRGASFERREVVAEVRALLVEDALGLRFATGIVRARVVEAAMPAAVQVDAARRAGVAPADALVAGDRGAAALTDEVHRRAVAGTCVPIHSTVRSRSAARCAGSE